MSRQASRERVAPPWPSQMQGRGRWPLWLDVVLLATTGGLHAMAFGVDGLWGLQVLGAAVLAWRAAAATPRHAAVLGWVFGTAWLGASVWWLYISMHTYGHLPGWMAGGAVALLCGTLALFLAGAMWVFARERSGVIWRDALLFASLWMLAELARGTVFTGFPWAASGYAHLDGPFASVASWGGVYGIGATAAALAALAVLSFTGRHQARPAWFSLAFAAGAMLALGLWGGGYHTRPGPTLQVTLLQPNVPQNEKFAQERLSETLRWVAVALTSAKGDLVVAPETAVPLLPEQLPEGYWDTLRAHLRQNGTAALVGVPLGSYAEGYTNSVAGVSAEADSLPRGQYRYDKHHLVPFGEFIPLGFRWFTNLMNIPLGDFNRGPLLAPSMDVITQRGRVRVAPNICYEDLFGEELAARFANPTTVPGVLANVSNIAWFGNTVAVPQHLQISRMRSLELQRPMIRATNTGATVVIDHTGRVTDSLPPFTRGALQGVVQAREGLTPYAQWASHYSLWPLWIAGFILWLVGRRWGGSARAT